MADTTKVVPIELDGETYNLKYTRKSWYLVDRETGRPVGDLFTALDRGSYSALCDLFWAGVVHERPKLRPEDVPDIIPLTDPERAKRVGEAMTEAFPDDMKGDVDPTEQPPADT